MNDNVDAKTACRRYQESLTPMLLIQFERRFFEAFGTTPMHAVPAEEAMRIYREVMA